jgi:hypothetical protein
MTRQNHIKEKWIHTHTHKEDKPKQAHPRFYFFFFLNKNKKITDFKMCHSEPPTAASVYGRHNHVTFLFSFFKFQQTCSF